MPGAHLQSWSTCTATCARYSWECWTICLPLSMAPCLGPIHKAGSTCTAACARYSWTVDLPLSMAPCLGPIRKAGSTCTASCLRLTHYVWLQASNSLKNAFPKCYLKNRPPQVHSCPWPVPQKTVFSCFSYFELMIQIHVDAVPGVSMPVFPPPFCIPLLPGQPHLVFES